MKKGIGSILSLSAAGLLLPEVTLAASSFKDLVNKTIVPIGNALVSVIYALAFLFFLAGAFRFFFLGGDEGREKGKQFMLWGIIAFAVLFSLWGIVRLLLASVGVTA